MSDISEAFGTAAEGGLLAKAVSSDGTPLEKGHFAEGACLNCGTELTGKHCHECGQKAHLHRTIGAFFHDLLHGALHLDGKVWRTLPLLILKPGQLTRRYVEGQRTSFVSPMALFLFSVFLMFAVFQALGISAPTDLRGDAREEVQRIVASEQGRIDDELAELNQKLEDPELGDASRSTLELERTELLAERDLLDARGTGIAQWITSRGNDAADDLQNAGRAQIDDAKERLAAMPTDAPERADLAAEIEAAELGMEQFERFEEATAETIKINEDGTARMTIEESGIGWIDEALTKWRSNPSLMLYKLQANAYKFSWLLIPISIPFVWILFAWKRRFKAYDHAIFVTYSIAFVSLLFIALSLVTAAGIGGGWVFLALAIIPPLHLYKHLKYAYGLTRLGALWRLALLHVFILVILLLFFQVLLLLGAF
uniref:DUF3667 domain-containing protein n=1 Tax=uncultured Altererythrobacter sp. TaxID=500840 RepID=UPI00260C8599|nr:DUF3667 domain-containing protein [uncultured Altererythrobacter sp.]